jgi:hypothetical protein
MASIFKHRSYDLFAISDGDENISGIATYNMAPAYIVAQASLYKVHGRAMHKIGIRSFTHRPTQDGPEKTVDFTEFYWNWPSTIGHDRVTSVTFGVFVSADNELEGHADLYWWK